MAQHIDTQVPMLTQREIARRIGVSERTLYKWRKAGRFPEPRRMTSRILRWDPAEVEEWLAAQ